MTVTRKTYQHSFRSMGTTIEVLLVAPEGYDVDALGTFARAERLAEDWERTFSRFRPDSEISRFNALAGSSVEVSPLLFMGIQIALRGSRQTSGLFDPTVLPALVALGYDRTFDELTDVGRTVMPTAVPGVDGIRLNAAGRRVTMPSGTQIDLGGVVKGLYVDVLAGSGTWMGGAISAGGDLRIWGTPPDGERWLVGIEDPSHTDRDLAQLRMDGGAVATSGTNRRNWNRSGRRMHHLIDPRTAQPAASGIRTASVVSRTAVQAEIAATALVVGGVDVMDVHDLFIEAVVVTDDGDLIAQHGYMEGRVDVVDLTAYATLAI